MNVLGHPRIVVFHQFRNALVKCFRDEPTTFRYGQMSDVHRTNLANRSTSSSPFGCPLAVASLVLVAIDVAVRVKLRKGDQLRVISTFELGCREKSTLWRHESDINVVVFHISDSR